MRRIHRLLFGICFPLLLMLLWFSAPIRAHIPLQPGCFMQIGEIKEWAEDLPAWTKPYLSLQVEGEAQGVFGAEIQGAVAIREENHLQMQAVHAGQSRVSLMLLDAIPLKMVEVEATEPCRLVPGGHSIGVVIHSDGVMVVGFAPVQARNGSECCPAGEQGIHIGDRIMEVNGHILTCEEDLAQVVTASEGKSLHFKLLREEKPLELDITPVYCPESEHFRVGLYVRDEVAGIGTLSFWNPENRVYAALGHMILDADTRQGIEVGQGQIVSAPVQQIQAGHPGVPGGKIGSFGGEGEIEGNILMNCLYGIYGVNEGDIHNQTMAGTMEVGYGRQVHLGTAEILTVLEGEKIERFAVEITRLYPGRSSGKNMLLKVVDERLLQQTGGIIQGMSGSPILQEGRMIGVVTHVLLNDPTRGYGVFMDPLLEHMPMVERKEKEQ